MQEAATRARASDSLPSPSRVTASPGRAGGRPCVSAHALLPSGLQGFAGMHVDDGDAVALHPDGDGDGLLLVRSGPLRAQVLVGVAEMTDDDHGQAVLDT